jgi:hypothetical protein
MAFAWGSTDVTIRLNLNLMLKRWLSDYDLVFGRSHIASIIEEVKNLSPFFTSFSISHISTDANISGRVRP